MYATFTTVALAFAAAQQPATPGQPGANPAAGARPSIDGNWTIICLEKDGQPVADARNMAVSIRGNTITFNKSGTTDPAPGMRAMRVEFGHNGTIRVSEADDNKFSTAPAAQPGAPSGTPSATKAGVYVLTHDYLAVCVHDTGARTGTAATTEPREVQPAAATAAQPAGQVGPQQRSYCTVILRRTEGSRPAATE
ncbi:hypothetical protein J0H58_01915 [bacterium]|mgnify:CR=1 FL=1|nr:hypothetical protein [bacterium]